MAYDFDGTGDFFDYGSLTVFNNLANASWSVFVQMDTLTADGGLLSNRAGPDNDGILFFFDDISSASGRTDSFSMFIENGANQVRVDGATGAATTGSWQHVGATFVGNDASGLRLYIDGAEDANSPISTASPNVTTTGTIAHPVQIGDTPGATRDIDGKLAEAAMWDRTLSAAEMAALAAGFSPLFFPGLIFYAPLIRDTSDKIGGAAATINGTPAVFAHPRMIYPSPLHYRGFVAAVGAVYRNPALRNPLIRM